MKVLGNGVVALAVALLTGCATTQGDLGRPVDSVTGAGVTSYRHSKPDGERTEVVLGKNYDAFSMQLNLADDGTIRGLDVSASGVSGADAQALAAQAVVAIRAALNDAERVRFGTLQGAVQAALEAFLATHGVVSAGE